MSPLRDRFDRPMSRRMERFSSSMQTDLRMVAEDIEASRAHAAMLGRTGILSRQEATRLRQALDRVREEIEDGTFLPGDELEDIHMAVEARLVEHVGDLGRKLHTARSRNDQVATDVRLWARKALDRLLEALTALEGAILERVGTDGRILVPGYTHLQRGQPILLGHHLLAHAWALERDRERAHEARVRLNRSPLGACALAGTGHPVDREETARDLGFDGVVENAMDAVSARDHLQEAVAVCAIAMTGLSRMAEELVLWSTAEFRFARLAPEHATGSSIMPQKRNPDAAELVRGKTARVHGALVALLSLLKGLPLSYNRDLQEDRIALFDALETTTESALLLAEVWRGVEFDAERFTAELDGDASLATELADAMAGAGVPFRTAHSSVAALMARLDREERTLADVTPAELDRIHEGLGTRAEELLDPWAAVERRSSRGGTAWSEVRRQLELLRRRLGAGETRDST